MGNPRINVSKMLLHPPTSLTSELSRRCISMSSGRRRRTDLCQRKVSEWHIYISKSIKKKRIGYSSSIHGLKTRASKTSFFNGRLSWQPILYNRLSNWQTTRANLISHISNFVTTIFQITSLKDCLRRLQILSYKLLITHVQHNSINKNNLPNRLALIDAPVTVIPITSHLFITSTLRWLVNSFNWWCNCG